MQKRSLNQLSICARCLRQRRQPYSCQTSNDTRLPATSPASGASQLKNRRLISIQGADAPKFLQGIITANVRPESRSGFYAAFLTAQGKVLSDAFIYPTLGSTWHSEHTKAEAAADHGYLVEVDGAQAERLMKHLRRHKLRSKLSLRLLEQDELGVWSVWREEDKWTAHKAAKSGDGDLAMTDMRAPGMGQRLLVPSPSDSGTGLSRSAAEDVERASEMVYQLRRYIKGVAEGQTEIPWDDSLPMNSNIDLMGGIDFKKGCYIGQELTIRTHHTGVVRRRILPVMLYQSREQPPEKLEYDSASSIRLPEGNTDIKRDDKRKRATGKLITGIGNIGLAMCRLEQMSDVAVSGEGSSFTADDRFVVQNHDGSELGIKAFVPSWLRAQIRDPKMQRRVE